MIDRDGNSNVRMGSERSFAIVFAVLFAIIGLFPLWSGGDVRLWSLALAAVFMIAGFAFPATLRPLNRLWFQFGLLLNRIVSPIVMGILFFLTVTPVGLLRRLFKPDPINQRIAPEAKSYWIEIDRDAARHSSMRKQF